MRVPVPYCIPMAAAVERVGAIAATSANLARGPDPTALDEVPDGRGLAHVYEIAAIEQRTVARRTAHRRWST